LVKVAAIRPASSRVCRLVAGGANAEAFPAERARHQIADLAMVVDDQDMRAAIHAPNLVRTGPFEARKL
jgi:hypothetical protein